MNDETVERRRSQPVLKFCFVHNLEGLGKIMKLCHFCLRFSLSSGENWPVPVAARSKAYVYGRSPAEIVGSNPTEGMDVCLL